MTHHDDDAPPTRQGEEDIDREHLGRLVREEWIAWAREQPAPKASWLVSWDGLNEPDREVDRRIGERLYREGIAAAETRAAALEAENIELRAVTEALGTLLAGQGAARHGAGGEEGGGA